MNKKISKLSLFFLIIVFIYPSYSIAQTKIDFSLNSLLTNQNKATSVPGELIIKLKQGQKPKSTTKPNLTGITSLDALNQKFQAYQIEPIFKNHQNDELGQYYKIRLPKESDLKTAKNEFNKLDAIEKTSLNYLAEETYTPDDPKYNDGSQWGLSKINMSSAWDHTLGLTSIVIANIDSGVDTDHDEISGKIWVNTADPINGLDDDGNGLIDDNIGWDYVANIGYAEYGAPCIDRGPADPNRTADNDPNPEPTGLDEDQCLYPGVDNGVNHGSYTAGIAAANTNNAIGMAGICPNCKIMALRVLDDEGWGTWTDVAQAITYAADKNADIVSMSLAGPYDETIMADAIHYAYDQGSILVAAAGNGDIFGIGYDIDPVANKLSPICNDNHDYLDGGDNQVIGVAATNSSDQKTTFSNYGKKYVDISAPGQSIYSLANGNGYGSGSGTSASTPFVAGVAGLVKSLNPTWDNKAIRDATIDLISNINSLNPSYSGKLGGRLDADRALDPTERLNGSGILIKGSGPYIYLLQNGQKRLVTSEEVYFSYFQSWNYYVTISDSRLNDYPNGPDLLFREGSLIKANNSPNVYQIEYPSATKRLIVSEGIFLGLGYYWNDIIVTTPEIVSAHPTGSDINSLGTHVAGALVKNNTNPEVYFLSSNAPRLKHLIIDSTVYTMNFRWQDIAIVDDIELNSYTTDTDYRFQDGSVLKGSAATIYLISYGKKRPFTSPESYTGRGYSWNQYITVSDDELTHYVTGEDLN